MDNQFGLDPEDVEDLQDLSFIIGIIDDFYVIGEDNLAKQLAQACDWVLSPDHRTVRRGLVNLSLFQRTDSLPLPSPPVLERIVEIALSGTIAPKARYEAIGCLEDYGPAVSRYSARLRSLLTGDEPETRAYAAVALQRIDPPRRDEYVAVLAAMLESPDPKQVEAAIDATILWKDSAAIEGFFPKVMAVYQRLPPGDQPRLRHVVLEWLGSNCPSSAEFQAVLAESLASPNTRLQRRARDTSASLLKLKGERES